MLKRKLRANIDNVLSAKRKAEDGKLDILFTHGVRTHGAGTSKASESSSTSVGRPTNVLECLHYIRGLVEWRKFCDKIPAVVLKSQLYSLFSDHTFIDSQISALRGQGQIIIIKLDSGTYGIVDREQYIGIVQKQMDDAELDKEAGEHFIGFCTKDELDVEIMCEQLRKTMKEKNVTTLIRAGFITSEVTGMYFLTIPNASLFLRTLNDGIRHVRSIIRKSKFREIQLTELLLREGKKTSKLGMVYYCLDIIGRDSVKLVSTSSGPILRYVDDD